MTYQVESERPDDNTRGRYATAVTGATFRVSDQMNVFGETKATHGTGSESLVHAFGLDLSPNDRWTYGFKGDWGIVSDPLSGDLKRQGVGVSARLQEGQDHLRKATSSSAHEEGSTGHRNVWLMRNALGYQADPDWRWFGKLDFSLSSNSQGAFYDGDYVELVRRAAPIAR